MLIYCDLRMKAPKLPERWKIMKRNNEEALEALVRLIENFNYVDVEGEGARSNVELGSSFFDGEEEPEPENDYKTKILCKQISLSLSHFIISDPLYLFTPVISRETHISYKKN